MTDQEKDQAGISCQELATQAGIYYIIDESHML
jgi:hypothetical protein